MSKGSRQRPTDLESYRDNYDRIFRKNRMTPKYKDDGEDVGTCGCGRSPTGKCIGWHGLTEEEFSQRLEDYQTGKRDLNGEEIN